MRTTPEVDEYVEGSDRWPNVIAALRPILLDCGLTETVKWRKPCYTHDGNNIVILQEMAEFLALMFFKGALLDDTDAVLEDQGPNSRSARRICFTTPEQVERLADTVQTYIAAAVEVEEAGLTVGPPPELVPCAELQQRLDDDPAFRAAFESLTPGRRREYDLHISGAKRSETRSARVDRCLPRILEGRGLRDR